MNLRDIDIFHAIMSAGGAGSAAQLLGISQPAVSRSLAHLERGLAFRLFDRIRGRLVPTREGHLFHAEVQRNLIGLDRLKQAAARIREVGEGQLRIATLAALGQSLVPRAVARFSKARPGVSVSLQIRTSAAVRDLVVTGQVDLGLAADEISTAGVHASVFATPRAVCVVPREHRLARARIVRPADLQGEKFVALSPEDTARKAIDRVLQSAEVAVQVVVETPFSATVATLVAEGAGIAIANPMAIDRDLLNRIVALPFEPAVYFKALVLKPPNADHSRLVQSFLDILYDVRNKGEYRGSGPPAERGRGRKRTREPAD